MTRVGVIGPVQPDLFAWHILETLPGMGVEAISLGTPKLMLARGPRLVMSLLSVAQRSALMAQESAKSLARRAIDARVDLVLTLNDNLTPPAVDVLKRAGIEVALWHPDHVANWGRMWFAISDYSRVFLTDPLAVGRLRGVQGLPAVYLPEACNPAVHRPLGSSPHSGTVVVAASTYPSRVRLLDRLHADGIPLELYGAPFPRWVPARPLMEVPKYPAIVLDDKARTFRGAGAVLNSLNTAENGLNCRIFEATGCGAAVLAEWRPAISGIFEPGEEVVTFRDYDELLKKTRWLLENPDEATKIGDRASKRSHAEHTYRHRLRTILESTL